MDANTCSNSAGFRPPTHSSPKFASRSAWAKVARLWRQDLLPVGDEEQPRALALVRSRFRSRW